MSRTSNGSLIYYRDRLFKHPFTVTNALKHLGPIDVSLAGFSYLQTWLNQPEAHCCDTAESWLKQRFGTHLYKIFFDSYCQKLWGQRADQLATDCAVIMVQTLLGDRRWDNPTQTIIEHSKGHIKPGESVKKLIHNAKRIEQIVLSTGESVSLTIDDSVGLNLPLKVIVRQLDPAPPAAILAAADNLCDRSTITITLTLSVDEPFTEQDIHVQSPNVQVSHIQPLQSAKKAGPSEQISLRMTYLCNEGDNLWHLDDDDLVQFAIQELMNLKLISETPRLVKSDTVLRQAAAYPVIDSQYYQNQAVIQRYLEQFENLRAAAPTGNPLSLAEAVAV